MRAVFSNVRIMGISTFVPPKIINIDSELDSIYKGDIKALERIKKVIGLQTRHIAQDNITASDMGLAAANSLLNALKIDRESISALIFVTQSYDYFLPATACYLHGKLNLAQSCLSFDINQACAGYIYGLYVAHSLLESNAAKRVLLIAGDTLSRFVNPKDSNLAPIIGDGVSATLLERIDLGNLTKPSFFDLGSQGEKFYQLIIPKGACRVPTREIILEPKVWEVSESRSLYNLYMDGAEIFNFAVMKYPQTFKDIFDYAGQEVSEIGYFFFHQANKYIVDNITRRLGLDASKVPNSTTSKYGNLSGCSIPATICDTLGIEVQNLDSEKLDSESLDSEKAQKSPKEPAKKDFSESKKELRIHLAGFGAGLSWGNAILSLDESFLAQKVQIYKPQ